MALNNLFSVLNLYLWSLFGNKLVVVIYDHISKKKRIIRLHLQKLLVRLQHMMLFWALRIIPAGQEATGSCGFRHKEGRPLTPYTCLAPALAANMERMPVPLPTSSTILSLKMCLLWYIEFLYVIVLTSSFSISCTYMDAQKTFYYFVTWLCFKFWWADFLDNVWKRFFNRKVQ